MSGMRAVLQRVLEGIVGTLLVGLVVVVVVGVVYRKLGNSLVWYDEIASIMLAWLTYYGASLAALKRSHIGFPGLVEAAPPHLRRVLLIIAELLVLGFFALLAWMGFYVLQVLEGDTLVSLPQVSVQITQSVIPIGACLFIVAQLASFPEVWRRSGAEGS
jgi:TRAP-type C4-dicarboxylate transport system permease small subunit